MSAITRSSGSERSKNARASGRAAVSSALSRPSTRSSHQRAASGNESSRSVSPVGAQSTTIASQSPDSAWRLELQQREQLVRARRHRQLLGGDPVDAALGEHPAQPLLRGRPVALELVLRLDLLGPHAVSDIGRLGAHRHLQRLGQRVRRDRWRARASARRPPRSVAPWPPRPTSCRRRPCPCTGWSGAPLKPRQSTVASSSWVSGRARSSCRSSRCPPGRARVSATVYVPALARHLPAEGALPVADGAERPRLHECAPRA